MICIIFSNSHNFLLTCLFFLLLSSLCSISSRSETHNLFVEGANFYDDFCRRVSIHTFIDQLSEIREFATAHQAIPQGTLVCRNIVVENTQGRPPDQKGAQGAFTSRSLKLCSSSNSF